MGIQTQSEAAVQLGGLSSTLLTLLPADFPLTDEETRKIELLAHHLNCTPEVAKRVLIFFVIFVSAYRREIAVASLPDILAQFPIKWGYKKKRHDVLHSLLEMDFIFVQTDYWAKVRAKKYALAASGQQLLERVLRSIFSNSVSAKTGASLPKNGNLPVAS